MSSGEGPSELLVLVTEYAWVLLLALVVLAGVGAFVTYSVQTAPDTETETEQQQVASWTTDTAFDHGAVVRADSEVFSRGERLRNRPLYFTRLAPVLEGEYALEYTGDPQAVEATVTLAAVSRSVQEFDDETFVHWEERESLSSEQVELAPGETERVSFEVNVTEAAQRTAEIQQSIGASPGSTEVAIEADTRVEIEHDGATFVQERQERLELNPQAGTYGIESDLEGERTEQRTQPVEREVPVEHSTLLVYGGPGLLLAGLAGLAGMGVLWRRTSFELDESTRDRLAFERAREDYDEWISRGNVPDSDGQTVVELDSLEGLVDVAIDSNSRVIETGDRYDVLADGVRYSYDPPAGRDGDTAVEGTGESSEGGGRRDENGGSGTDGSTGPSPTEE